MAYRIDYGGTGEPEKFPENTRKKGNRVWPVACICLVLLLSFLYPKKHVLEKLLIPGDPQVTKSAAKNLIEDLRAGEGISNSLQAFCTEIITHADIF